MEVTENDLPPKKEMAREHIMFDQSDQSSNINEENVLLLPINADVTVVVGSTATLTVIMLFAIYFVKSYESCVRQRYVVVACMFFGFAIAYTTRVNFSVAIVVMVNDSYSAKGNHIHDINHTRRESCPNLTPKNATNRFEEGEFKWNHYTQGIILSSFYYGYIFTQLPGGILADKYGAKHVIGLSIFLGTILSLLLPLAARTSVYLLISVRILQGVFQGFSFPAATRLVAAWAPINERSLMTCIFHIGSNFGVVVAFSLSGYLCESGFAGGWPSAFYVFGVLGVVWYPAWLYFVSNSPKDHPRISKKERDYILLSLPANNELMTSVPWFQILKSVRVWATIISTGGGIVSFGALIAFLPTYMVEILKYDTEVGGIVSTTPHLSSLFTTPIAGCLSDFLAIKFRSVTISRKVMVFCSNIVCGALIACIPVAGCDRTAVITLLVLSGALGSFMSAGNSVNPIDLAPQFAGFIFALANIMATVGMTVGPYMTGALINDAQTLEAWARAFYVMAGLSIGSGVFFLLFGSGDIQSWAVATYDRVVNIDNGDQDERE